jgi:hypothetical protein
MTIRFLQTTPSEAPGAPFMAGQIIHIAEPPAWMLAYLDGVHAEAVREHDEPEYATVRAPRPTRKGRARGTR